MFKKGIDNVRGSIYSRIVLKEEEKKQIKKILYEKEDRCFKCGEKGHFIKQCKKKYKENVLCFKCKRKGHISSECRESEDIDGNIIV